MIDENLVVQLVRRKVVTDRFRRLPPEKKDLIYRAAIRLFGTYGYDGLPVDRLCTEAGISKGSFFQYFPSKSHLLEFAVLAFDDFLTTWLAEIRRQESAVLARDRLRHLYHAVVVNAKLFPAEKTFYLFITNASPHTGVQIEGIALERHFHKYVQEIIERGGQTGEIRRDVDPAVTGVLVSLVFGALVGRAYAGTRERRPLSSDYVLSMMFDGVKA
jgi:AcrR family transcriptional regulator